MFEEVETNGDGVIIGLNSGDTHFDLSNFWNEGVVVVEKEDGEEVIKV